MPAIALFPATTPCPRKSKLAVSAYSGCAQPGGTLFIGAPNGSDSASGFASPGDAALRGSYQQLLSSKGLAGGENNDVNYIFLRFVLDYLPIGMVGLLIAVIFLAAWGSIAAALNALASCSVVDIHKKFIRKECSNEEDYRTSRLYTLGWGIFCIITAQFASHLGSLIEAVNILGSLFYGTMLGIFLVAFYLKRAGGTAVFWSALVAECGVVALFKWFPRLDSFG